jgi:hypothetical protein
MEVWMERFIDAFLYRHTYRTFGVGDRLKIAQNSAETWSEIWTGRISCPPSATERLRLIPLQALRAPVKVVQIAEREEQVLR